MAKECRLVALHQMSDPRQRKSCYHQQRGHRRMKPDHEQRRKSGRNGQHMQPAIYRMVVGVVVMGIQAHGSAASRAATSVAEGTVRSLMKAVILSEEGSRAFSPARETRVEGSWFCYRDTYLAMLVKLRRRLQQKSLEY